MPLMPGPGATADRITAWECIGCGRIEGPQPCIGVCQDRKVEFVYATVHEQALAQLRNELHSVTALVRQLAHTTPRQGEWEHTYRVLQQQARQVLSRMAADTMLDRAPQTS